MAMIKIYKHNKSLSVPAGAYLSQYAPNGWGTSVNDTVETDLDSLAEQENTPEQSEMVPEDDNEEEEETTEYVSPEDLKEKPIEDLNYKELQLLAKDMGVDIAGLKSSKSLRDAISKQAKL